MIFESEALENVPGGWKARETYEIVSSDEFIERFEIASTAPTRSTVGAGSSARAFANLAESGATKAG